MKQGRFSSEQIFRLLRLTNADRAAVVGKLHGKRDPPNYIWHKKFIQLVTGDVKPHNSLGARS